MIKVNNEKLKEKYINKYDLNNIFSNDMKEYMELILFEKNQYICRENEKIEYIFFLCKRKSKGVYSITKWEIATFVFLLSIYGFRRFRNSIFK